MAESFETEIEIPAAFLTDHADYDSTGYITSFQDGIVGFRYYHTYCEECCGPESQNDTAVFNDLPHDSQEAILKALAHHAETGTQLY